MHVVSMWSHVLDLLMQAGVLPAHYCSAIISLSAAVFYVKPLLLNGIRHQFANPTADEPSTSINEVNASTTYSFDGVPLS